MEIQTTKKVCDICGEEVDGDAWFVARNAAGDIIWESKIVGDYCPRHSEALILGGLNKAGIAERYDRFDTDAEREAKLAVERALIDGEIIGGFDD